MLDAALTAMFGDYRLGSSQVFRVRRRCRHVITENARVLASEAALARGDVARFGQLMNEAHESMSRDYEASCAEVDTLAALCRAQEGVLGARVTGAGWGGCVVALARRAARRTCWRRSPSATGGRPVCPARASYAPRRRARARCVEDLTIPDLGVFGPEDGLHLLPACSDGRFRPGRPWRGLGDGDRRWQGRIHRVRRPYLSLRPLGARLPGLLPRASRPPGAACAGSTDGSRRHQRAAASVSGSASSSRRPPACSAIRTSP